MAMKTNRALEVVQATYGVTEDVAFAMLNKTYKPSKVSTCLKTYLDKGFVEALIHAQNIFNSTHVSSANVVDVIATSNHIRNSSTDDRNDMASLLFGAIFKSSYKYLNEGLANPHNVTELLNNSAEFEFDTLEHRLFVVGVIFQELQALGHNLDTPTISVPMEMTTDGNVEMKRSALGGIYAEDLTPAEIRQNELLLAMTTDSEGRSMTATNLNKGMHNPARGIQEDADKQVRNLYDGCDLAAILAGCQRGWIQYTVNSGTWNPLKVELRKVATYINATLNADSAFKINTEKGCVSLAQKCANALYSLYARIRINKEMETRLSIRLTNELTVDAGGSRQATPSEGRHSRDNELYRKSDKFKVTGGANGSEPYAGTNDTASKLEAVRAQGVEMKRIADTLGQIPFNLLAGVNASVARNNDFDGREFEIGYAAGCVICRRDAVHQFIIVHLDDDAEGWREFEPEPGVVLWFKDIEQNTVDATVTGLLDEWAKQKTAKADPEVNRLLGGIIATVLETEQVDVEAVVPASMVFDIAIQEAIVEELAPKTGSMAAIDPEVYLIEVYSEFTHPKWGIQYRKILEDMRSPSIEDIDNVKQRYQTQIDDLDASAKPNARYSDAQRKAMFENAMLRVWQGHPRTVWYFMDQVQKVIPAGNRGANFDIKERFAEILAEYDKAVKFERENLGCCALDGEKEWTCPPHIVAIFERGMGCVNPTGRRALMCLKEEGHLRDKDADSQIRLIIGRFLKP